MTSTPLTNTTLVTHAHSDHTAAIPGPAKTYLTEITMDLYHTTHQRGPKNYTYVHFHEPFEIGSFEIEFIPAGHLIGAAQIVVRQGQDNFLYTGDFCPEELLTVEAADTPKDIDLLVMDSTYGSELIAFDPRPDTRQRIFVWIISTLGAGLIPMINVAHLGGAQEIIRLCNTLANKMPIIVDDQIADVADVYRSHGVELDYIRISSEEAVEYMQSKCIILMPRSFKKIKETLENYPLLKNRYRRAIVTGQTAKYGFTKFDFAAPLSTHAHFHELIETVNQIDPSHVFTHYGYAKELADHLLQEHNCSAQTLESCNLISFDQLKKRNELSYRAKQFGYIPLDEMF